MYLKGTEMQQQASVHARSKHTEAKPIHTKKKANPEAGTGL